jgi:hypothetical protein
MLPGDAVIPGKQAKSRSTPRIPVGHSAWVTLQTHDGREHVAFVKDVSSRGIFLYSDFKPPIGDQLDFSLEYLSGSNRVRLHLSGRVVRVEQSVPGTTIGVAVSFDSVDIQKSIPSDPISER